MSQVIIEKNKLLTISELFFGCETKRGKFQGVDPSGKKIAWEEPCQFNWEEHFKGSMQGKSPVNLETEEAKWYAIDVDLDLEPKTFCRDVFSKIGFEYFVFRTFSGRFRVVKFFDDWHNPEDLKKEAEQVVERLDQLGYKCDIKATAPSGWNYKEQRPGRWIFLPYSKDCYCYTPDGLPLTLNQFEYRANNKTNPFIVACVGVGNKPVKDKAIWVAVLHNKVYPNNKIDIDELHKNFGEEIKGYGPKLIQDKEKKVRDPKWNLESYLKGLSTWIKDLVGVAPEFDQKFSSQITKTITDNYLYVSKDISFYDIENEIWYNKEGLNDTWYHLNKGKPIVKDLLNDPNLTKVYQTLVHPGFHPGVIELGHEEIPGIKKGRYFNLYKPSNFTATPGDCSKFFEYWKWAINNDDYADIFFQYIAIHFQHPGFKSHWSILIQSAPGLGKDLFSEIMGNALGTSNVVLNCPFDKMTNDHSTLIEGKQIIFVNELILTGQFTESKILANKLKPYITNNTLVVNPKFKQERTVPNYVNLFLFTNDEKPLHVDKDDRRLFVLKIPRTKEEIKEKLIEYLPHLKDLKKNPSYFIYAFKNYKINSLDFFHGDAPWTEYKQELIKDSQGDFNTLMDSAFEEKTFPFASKNFGDKTSSESTESTWGYRGFINIENLSTALQYDPKFKGVFKNNFMLEQWVKKRAQLWPDGTLQRRGVVGKSKIRLWILEDMEVELESKIKYHYQNSTSAILYRANDDPNVKLIPSGQPLPPNTIMKKISELTETELGKQYEKCKFTYKSEKEYHDSGKICPLDPDPEKAEC